LNCFTARNLHAVALRAWRTLEEEEEEEEEEPLPLPLFFASLLLTPFSRRPVPSPLPPPLHKPIYAFKALEQ
jgi:hypothetical protein